MRSRDKVINIDINNREKVSMIFNKYFIHSFPLESLHVVKQNSISLNIQQPFTDTGQPVKFQCTKLF